MAPADGDRRLTSAITPTAMPATAGALGRGVGTPAAARSRAGARSRRVAMRARASAKMASREVGVILAFGRFSGRLASGYIREKDRDAHPPSARDPGLHLRPYRREGLRPELRGDRPAVRLSVPGHGPRASPSPINNPGPEKENRTGGSGPKERGAALVASTRQTTQQNNPRKTTKIL